MKVNWALVGIVAGFVVTLTIVLLIVFSPPTFVGPELPTATSTPVGGTVSATLVRHDDGCFFVDLDGVETYAIWPDGFVRDGESISGQDLRFDSGDTFEVLGTVTDRATAVGDNEYLNRVTGTCMGSDSDDPVILIDSIG